MDSLVRCEICGKAEEPECHGYHPYVCQSCQDELPPDPYSGTDDVAVDWWLDGTQLVWYVESADDTRVEGASAKEVMSMWRHIARKAERSRDKARRMAERERLTPF